MRLLVRIPLPRQEAFWNGIHPELGMVVCESEIGSELPEFVLEPLREMVGDNGTFALILGSAERSIEEEAVSLRAMASTIAGPFHLHSVKHVPSLVVLANLGSESLFVMYLATATLPALCEEVVRCLPKAGQLSRLSDRGVIINLSRNGRLVVSLVDEASSVAYYGPAKQIAAIVVRLNELTE